MDALKYFQHHHPHLPVRLVDAAEPVEIEVRRSDSVGADKTASNCQVARAIKKRTNAIDAYVQRTVAHVLLADGRAMKYNHDGREIVEVNDRTDVPYPNTTIRLNPPKGIHRVGQNQDSEARKETVKTIGKQTPEHVAARVASRHASDQWYHREEMA